MNFSGISLPLKKKLHLFLFLLLKISNPCGKSNVYFIYVKNYLTKNKKITLQKNFTFFCLFIGIFFKCANKNDAAICFIILFIIKFKAFCEIILFIGFIGSMWQKLFGFRLALI